ncbi:hypothetical protein SmJEL517_g01321 [Synchytrium microbalum]|uniref:Mitochondrial carrier protein n=1 Tax=Synchytrium microbalum TaxID=1806994 RepID=A0A507CAJ8_9FUNG|nr:uncharacterized protein SmJEL517_g01321 [Synchytrium microbalum]TPX36642.1 hypothetical protein SmJEL517_g01321 [Synchytrium microbalum]
MTTTTTTQTDRLTHLDFRPVLSSPEFRHSLAGMGAGCISSLVTVPLDVVKIRLQNQGALKPGQLEHPYKGTFGTLKTIWLQGGIRGLYRGIGPTLCGYIPTWGFYFTAYDYGKRYYSTRLKRKPEDSLVHLMSAMSAGLLSTAITNPLWVIRTRFMTQSRATAYHYSSTWSAFATIIRVEGWRTLYKGLGPSLLGVSHVCVQFPLYEKLKSWIQENQHGTPLVKHDGWISGYGILLASGISKMVASTATYPHEVLRTRLQTQTHASELKYRGLIHTVRVILHEEGVSALYKGLPTNLIRTVPAAAITILTYETLSAQLHILSAT